MICYPVGLMGPYAGDMDGALFVCFLQGKKAERSTLYDLVIITTQWILSPGSYL